VGGSGSQGSDSRRAVVSRGDIYWLEHPELGRRPSLVLTRNEALPALRSVTVALLTSSIRGIPTEVRLGPEDGMPKDCVISLDNVYTFPAALLAEPIASLAGKRMHEVCRALAIATGCDWRPSRL
jgi:mRNA interferase MazF